jgi:hypothetical protein
MDAREKRFVEDLDWSSPCVLAAPKLVKNEFSSAAKSRASRCRFTALSRALRDKI